VREKKEKKKKKKKKKLSPEEGFPLSERCWKKERKKERKKEKKVRKWRVQREKDFLLLLEVPFDSFSFFQRQCLRFVYEWRRVRNTLSK
jgi:hypothetical protein